MHHYGVNFVRERLADDLQLALELWGLQGEVSGYRRIHHDGIQVLVEQVEHGQVRRIVFLERCAVDLTHGDGAGRADLGADCLARQVLVAGNGGFVYAYHNCLSGVDVGIGEISLLLAVVRDGDRRENGVVIAAGQPGKDTVPGRVLDLKLEVLILGDGCNQIDVKADDILLFVHKFHGREGCVAGKDEFLRCCSRGRSRLWRLGGGGLGSGRGFCSGRYAGLATTRRQGAEQHDEQGQDADEL